jgi:hypothetical protein
VEKNSFYIFKYINITYQYMRESCLSIRLKWIENVTYLKYEIRWVGLYKKCNWIMQWSLFLLMWLCHLYLFKLWNLCCSYGTLRAGNWAVLLLLTRTVRWLYEENILTNRTESIKLIICCRQYPGVCLFQQGKLRKLSK